MTKVVVFLSTGGQLLSRFCEEIFNNTLGKWNSFGSLDSGSLVPCLVHACFHVQRMPASSAPGATLRTFWKNFNHQICTTDFLPKDMPRICKKGRCQFYCLESQPLERKQLQHSSTGVLWNLIHLNNEQTKKGKKKLMVAQSPTKTACWNCNCHH